MDLNALPRKDYLTIGAAVLGAGLGIMNTWNTMSARRVRLKVLPAHAVVPSGDLLFSIEVINLSTFPVTVKEVGFALTGDPGRGAVTYPILPDGEPWPRRLEAREAVTVLCNPLASFPTGTRIGKAYARLTSGEERRGSSPALRQLQAALATGSGMPI